MFSNERLRLNIRQRLKVLGMSQNDLAKATGRSSGSISMILSGQRELDLRHIDQLATVLKTSPAALVREIGPAT